MKAPFLFSTAALAFGLLAAPIRADEPHPAALSPEMQALVAQLLQAATAAQAESVPVPPAGPATVVAPAAPAIARGAGSLRTGRLVTGSLHTASLTPSAPIGGRGTTGGVARLNDEDWRLLFPIRQP